MAKKQKEKNNEVILALKAIVEEKGISEELLFDTLEDALVAAYRKNYASSGTENVRVDMNKETGEIKVFSLRQVVSEVNDKDQEISLEEAKAIDEKYELLDMVQKEVTPENFARVAAQSAKQIVTQRIREAERNIVYDEFHEKEFDIVIGHMQRKDKGNLYIDLGKTETILPPSEQIMGEEYEFNEKIVLYVVEVKQNPKGPMILVSRTHPGLVKRLFEKEVPEIYDGIVEINAISREAGSRTKIAVSSNDPEVEPMGACVGPRGIRVQNIVNELGNEKIDIIKWSEDPAELIENALSPAKVINVIIDEDTKSSKVIVDDNQLSLAIGKEGQNVRLAAKLTGWKIDIKNEEQYEKELQDALEKEAKEDPNVEKAIDSDLENLEKLEDEADIEGVIEDVDALKDAKLEEETLKEEEVLESQNIERDIELVPKDDDEYKFKETDETETEIVADEDYEYKVPEEEKED
ncbi:MAG: transcription termination/antitermination protein NusA [Clostridium sp.]|nr:transcription termination/antitermination protein NusA [Clostridium sp.]